METTGLSAIEVTGASKLLSNIHGDIKQHDQSAAANQNS
jgi:hypothetical protein